MQFIDFIIGLTLVNGMPHFVLGIWKGRMLSGFGVGDRQNLLYGLLNFGIAGGLFVFQYGLEGVKENGVFVGAYFTIVMYLILGKFFYTRYHKRFYANEGRS